MAEFQNESITDIDELCALINNFLTSDNESCTIAISCYLRKPIRQFKNWYPNLFYFAYGLSDTYCFVISKHKFTIDYFDLTPRCKKLFIECSGIKMDHDASREDMLRIEEYCNVKMWFELLSDVLLFVGGEKEFVSKHYDLRNNIRDDIKASPSYAEWAQAVIEKCELTGKYPFIKVSNAGIMTHNDGPNGIYSVENNNRYFISIDIKAANFQMLQQHGLITERTWVEYISKFVAHPYFAKLKIFRLQALSAKELFPAKQKACWQNATIGILDNLLGANIAQANNFVFFNSDEIILRTTVDTATDDVAKYQAFISSAHPNLNINLKVFQLKILDISPENGRQKKPTLAYVKVDPQTNKIEFKCVNSKTLLVAIDKWAM